MRQRFRTVKGEYDHEHNGQIEEDHGQCCDQRADCASLFFHAFPPLVPLRSALRTKVINNIITIAIMTEIAEPKFHSPTVMNWFSMTLPIKNQLPTPSSFGMKKAEIAG